LNDSWFFVITELGLGKSYLPSQQSDLLAAILYDNEIYLQEEFPSSPYPCHRNHNHLNAHEVETKMDIDDISDLHSLL